MTFSIVAWDEREHNGGKPEWGIAVASKFLAVGSAVPWASAGAGGVATQALANLSYGPDGLDLLREGLAADAVLEKLTSADEDREHRQLGVVDSKGRAASFTGKECFDWAGGIVGDGFCCQGNILTGKDVVDEMASTFTSTEGPLVDRLLAALSAGDAAGGDRRGRQSASVYVVREGAGYGGTIDIAVDLRVDDHREPIPELLRLLELQRLYFPDEASLEFVEIDDELASELRRRFRIWEGTGYDDRLKAALYEYVGTENLEERWRDDARIEVQVLDYIRRNA